MEDDEVVASRLAAVWALGDSACDGERGAWAILDVKQGCVALPRGEL